MKHDLQLPTPFLLAILALVPASLFAHTGIGQTEGFGAGFFHPIGGIDHLLAMVAVGLWAAQMGQRAVFAVPAAFVGVMIIGGLLGILGISLFFVEEGILGSVLVFGVLIAAALRFSLIFSAGIVGFFALFHGHAHGAEMPAAIGAMSYTLGFVFSTVLLHLCGIALGAAFQKQSAQKALRLTGGAIAACGLLMIIA